MNLFEGLRVLDVAGYIVGPSAESIVSNFGANVVKIKMPGEGESFRAVYRYANLAYSEHNFLWMQADRSRRGLALDLKQPDTQAGAAPTGRAGGRADHEPPPTATTAPWAGVVPVARSQFGPDLGLTHQL